MKLLAAHEVEYIRENTRHQKMLLPWDPDLGLWFVYTSDFSVGVGNKALQHYNSSRVVDPDSMEGRSAKRSAEWIF